MSRELSKSREPSRQDSKSSGPSRRGSQSSVEPTAAKALPEAQSSPLPSMVAEGGPAEAPESRNQSEHSAAGSHTASSPSNFDDVVDMVDPMKQLLRPKIGALHIAQAWRDSVESIKAETSPCKLRAEAMLWRQLNIATLHGKGKTHRRFWGPGKEECFICQGRSKPTTDGDVCFCYGAELLDLFEHLRGESSGDEEVDAQQSTFPRTPDSLDDRPMGDFRGPPQHWVLAQNWTKFYTCSGMPTFSPFQYVSSDQEALSGMATDAKDFAPAFEHANSQEVTAVRDAPVMPSMPPGRHDLPPMQQMQAENQALRAENGDLRGRVDELRDLVQNMTTEAENERGAFQVAMKALREELEAERMKNRAHEQRIRELEDKSRPTRLAVPAQALPPPAGNFVLLPDNPRRFPKTSTSSSSSGSTPPNEVAAQPQTTTLQPKPTTRQSQLTLRPATMKPK